MNVKIVNMKTIPVAALEHKGSPEQVNASALQFIEWRKSSGLSPVASSQTYGVPYQDPKTVPPEEFRFDICGSVNGPVPPNPQGVINKDIPGGKCAVVRHKGSHEQIDQSVHYLYGQWLPQSGEELRDFPCYFHYLNLIPEVEEHALLTDIYLPLK